MRKKNIGRNVIGFKFETSGNLSYASEMNNFIGQIGKITDQDCLGYQVKFSKNEHWWYPIKEVEEQLAQPIVVEDELTLDEILEKIKNL